MTLHRFFVELSAMAGASFPVPEAIAHQVTHVLRLRDGEEIVLLGGDGRQARCRLEGGTAKLRVLERGEVAGEPRHRLTLWQALLKGDALEHVVRQGTELGVAAFRLMVCDRCVVRELSPRRLERLRAIAREAAEQSERGRFPEVAAPVPLEAAFRAGAVLLYERAPADGPRLGEIEPPRQLIIGPEGGFSDGEVAAARKAGVPMVGLGPRILRAESVAAAVAAIVLSRSGDFA